MRGVFGSLPSGAPSAPSPAACPNASARPPPFTLHCTLHPALQVGAFVVWYMYDSFLGIDLSRDGHSTVTWDQLRNWQKCSEWEGFTAKPYTVAGGWVHKGVAGGGGMGLCLRGGGEVGKPACASPAPFPTARPA